VLAQRQLVVGEQLDSLDEAGTAVETRSDLGGGGASCAPSEYAALQRSQHRVVTHTRGGSSGQPRETHHSFDEFRAAPETPGDLRVIHALARQTKNPAFDRS
jgi:hypothetical protein